MRASQEGFEQMAEAVRRRAEETGHENAVPGAE